MSFAKSNIEPIVKKKNQFCQIFAKEKKSIYSCKTNWVHWVQLQKMHLYETIGNERCQNIENLDL